MKIETSEIFRQYMMQAENYGIITQEIALYLDLLNDVKKSELNLDRTIKEGDFATVTE